MDRAPPVQRTALHSDHVRPLDDLPQPTDRPAPSLDARSPKERHPKMPVPQVEAAPPCSTTPHPNNSAGGDVAQTRSPAGIVEQPPAAVLAFPMRNSNFARGCIASLDVSPAARITGFAIADCAAVHPRPMKYRHIQAGDCAAYPRRQGYPAQAPGAEGLPSDHPQPHQRDGGSRLEPAPNHPHQHLRIHASRTTAKTPRNPGRNRR